MDAESEEEDEGNDEIINFQTLEGATFIMNNLGIRNIQSFTLEARGNVFMENFKALLDRTMDTIQTLVLNEGELNLIHR